jgi:hypothetical protein
MLNEARAVGFLSVKVAAPESFIHDLVRRVRAKDSPSSHQFYGTEICGNNFCIFYSLVKRWKAISQKLLDHVEQYLVRFVQDILCESNGRPILLFKLRYAHPGRLTFNIIKRLAVFLAE